MVLITIDGKRWDVKYIQNKENLTNTFGTGVFEHADFIGSKLYQNSTSSDRYNLNFAIKRNVFVSFKESIKKFVSNPEDAIEDDEYGKLLNIIIEHPKWGAIKGKFTDTIQYNTASEGDIVCSGVFQEHTEDEPIEKTDIEQENSDAVEEVNAEEFDGEVEKGALLTLLDDLNELYDTITNSEVVAAFNDAQAALNDAVLNVQKVMNAFKKILALPGKIFSAIDQFKRQFDFFKKQATAIKRMPRATANMARFNIQCLAYNFSRSSRTPFVSDAAREAAAGIKTVKLD